MGESKSHVREGIALLSIALAFALTYFTTHVYYGPVLLLCVGGIMIALSYLPEKESRKAPVLGVLLAILGAALIIELLSGGQEVILTVFLLIVVTVEGVRLLFK